MARFRCLGCAREGEFAFDPTRHECPRCGSPDVRIAVRLDEMPDELLDQMIESLSRAEPLDDHPTDEDC
ncbi:hypothetical protein [Bradyrhizobium sp. RDM4]|uniref:hypothetical protein n=1 Tax=Bradyrhizobium sp. RDM4 TaxID=3378765 RepID=UPI0038FC736E